MASDETTTFYPSLQGEDFDNDIDDGYDDDDDDHHHQHQHPQPHPNNLSRLSVCNSSNLCGFDDDDDDEEDVDNAMALYVSGLSIESSEGDGDADGEFSDGKELPAGLSSDSENELGSCYSLPDTPPRRRNRVGLGSSHAPIAVKDYASDNEAQKGVLLMGQKTKTKNHPWGRIRNDRRVFDRANNNRDINSEKNNSKKKKKKKKKEEEHVMIQGFSGESDQSMGKEGVRVITRPKGGRRSLCMDMEEVKACRDLGFELVHERMLEMPSRFLVSNSTLNNTSSDGNSPMANWRISSPGDDPRDVKARIKMWAQAVALASASKCGI